jgi:heme/copper-type cytochrome/quinol oxidase subunit 2
MAMPDPGALPMPPPLAAATASPLFSLLIGVLIFAVVIVVIVVVMAILQAVLPRTDSGAEAVHERELEAEEAERLAPTGASEHEGDAER